MVSSVLPLFSQKSSAPVPREQYRGQQLSFLCPNLWLLPPFSRFCFYRLGTREWFFVPFFFNSPPPIIPPPLPPLLLARPQRSEVSCPKTLTPFPPPPEIASISSSLFLPSTGTLLVSPPYLDSGLYVSFFPPLQIFFSPGSRSPAPFCPSPMRGHGSGPFSHQHLLSHYNPYCTFSPQNNTGFSKPCFGPAPLFRGVFPLSGWFGLVSSMWAQPPAVRNLFSFPPQAPGLRSFHPFLRPPPVLPGWRGGALIFWVARDPQPGLCFFFEEEQPLCLLEFVLESPVPLPVHSGLPFSSAPLTPSCLRFPFDVFKSSAAPLRPLFLFFP